MGCRLEVVSPDSSPTPVQNSKEPKNSKFKPSRLIKSVFVKVQGGSIFVLTVCWLVLYVLALTILALGVGGSPGTDGGGGDRL